MTWNCFTCHFGNTVDETDTEIIAPKVDSGEETPSAARAGTRNRDLSITSPFHCPPRFHFNLDRLSLVTACPVDVLLSTSFAALSVAGLPLFLPHFSFQCQPPVVVHSLGLVRCYHGSTQSHGVVLPLGLVRCYHGSTWCYSPSWSCPLLPWICMMLFALLVLSAATMDLHDAIRPLGLVRCYHGSAWCYSPSWSCPLLPWIYTKSRCYSPSWSCPLLPLMGLHAPWLLPSWVRCGFFFQR